MAPMEDRGNVWLGHLLRARLYLAQEQETVHVFHGGRAIGRLHTGGHHGTQPR